MPRPRQHKDDEILDATLRVLAKKGSRGLSVKAVCAAADVPSGVIYNRYPSRNALLLALWVRTVQRFQNWYSEALGAGSNLPGAAVFVVRWAREHRDEARFLLLHQREELMELSSAEGRRDMKALSAQLAAIFAKGLRGSRPTLDRGRALFALVQIPKAAIRPYLLRDAAIPLEADEWVRDAVKGVLAPGR